MKPYYTNKGRYSDGRKKVCIEYQEGTKVVTKFLPKPEKLLYYLGILNYGKKKIDPEKVENISTGKKSGILLR